MSTKRGLDQLKLEGFVLRMLFIVIEPLLRAYATLTMKNIVSAHISGGIGFSFYFKNVFHRY
ncbi:hypothetical protein QFZ77_002606 [Paenibacillus sp. V4I3]|uniref:hypothetical protein n=1 Tax=Paenibacillus sp. V4I3 TaxID=3042305 RepID=UPI002782737D|nr:hypothetical protein [Paenibacillus sp. V4I3]MDQ0873947.1 hypothetical protein [Paenibacillus sp. V4I3]